MWVQLVVILGVAGSAFAQITVEEAEARLKQRQLERQKAGAVQPEAPKAESADVKARVDAGCKELTAQNYDAAKSHFATAIRNDRRNAVALHGLAVCYFELHDNAKAISNIDAAMDATPNRKPDRALVLNFAAISLAGKRPLPAMKALTEFAGALHDPDEELANALGSCIDAVPLTARSGPLFTSGSQAYDKLDAQLNALHSDKQRWGSTWLAPGLQRNKVNALRATLRHLEQCRADLKEAEQQAHADKLERDRAAGSKFFRAGSEQSVRSANNRADYSQSRIESAKAELAKAEDRYIQQRPPFTAALSTVPIHLSAGEQPTPFALGTSFFSKHGKSGQVAQETERRILAYIAQQQPLPEIAESLWEGKPAIGMDALALQIIGTEKPISEDQKQKVVGFTNEGYRCTITIKSETVASIQWQTSLNNP